MTTSATGIDRMPQRNLTIDFMKFMAAIFITNSHFIPLYKDVNIAYATLGVHGNALFFFTAGFALTLGKTTQTAGFHKWYKHKVERIWPTFIVWPILASLLFSQTISWKNFLLADGYWFIQCIMIYYLLFYHLLRQSRRVILYGFVASIILTILTVIYTPIKQGSIYHSFHYICYLPSMILGLYCGSQNVNKCKWGGGR